MQDSLVTSIVLKNNVTLVDVVSTRMLGQYGFLATVFDIFRSNQVGFWEGVKGRVQLCWLQAATCTLQAQLGDDAAGMRLQICMHLLISLPWSPTAVAAQTAAAIPAGS